MAKKEKLQDPLRKEKLILTGFLVVTFILLVSFVAYYIAQSNYFIKIDGKTVATEKEFRLNLMANASMYSQFGMSLDQTATADGKTVLEVVKEDTLTEMIRQKIVMQEAKKENVSFLENEEFTYGEQLDRFKENIGEDTIETMQFSDKELENIFQTYLYDDAMFEYVNKEYERDEKLFSEYLETFIESNWKSYSTVLLEFIDTKDMEEAQEVKEKMEAGEDFEQLFREYSVTYKAEVEQYKTDLEEYENAEEDEEKLEPLDPENREVVPVSYTQVSITEDDEEAMFESEVGTYFISSEEENPYVFRIQEMTPADEGEMKEDAGLRFDNEQKEAVYESKYQEWRQQYKVKYNEQIYDAIQFR